jgi:fructokinase
VKHARRRDVANLYGSIEAGGTKFVLAVGTAPLDIRKKAVFPTTTPRETLGQTVDFFRSAEAELGPLSALGLACFGPVDLRKNSPAYGSITSTPKPGWRNTDILGILKTNFSSPMGFDTDVNGAALGEARWGAARKHSSVLYLTVGTGIGGGALVDGRPLHGLVHPEIGHIRVPHDPRHDNFPGCCIFHGDCLEGLAAGPAIQKRWGRPAEDLTGRPEVWDLEAGYLAAGIVNCILTLSPEIVILGGGVMNAPGLLSLVREKVRSLLGGYIDSPGIVPPGLGPEAGIAGGFVLAENALLSMGESHD